MSSLPAKVQCSLIFYMSFFLHFINCALLVKNCPSLFTGLASLDELVISEFDSLPTVYCDLKEGSQNEIVISALFGSHWTDISEIAKSLSASDKLIHTLNIAVYENELPLTNADIGNWPLSDDFHLVIDMCQQPLQIDDVVAEILAQKLTVLDIGSGCIQNTSTLPSYFSKLSKLGRTRLNIMSDTFHLSDGLFNDTKPEKLHSIYFEGSGSLVLEQYSLLPLAKSLVRFSLGPNLKVNESVFMAINTLEKLKKLNLDGIHLEELPPGALNKLTQLEELWLQKNDLKTLEKGALLGLENLKELHLELNLLESIEDGTFMDTPNLEILKIRGNYLANLTNETFAGLQNLDQLDLAYNEFTIVPDYVFMHLGKLRNLDLGAKKPTYSQITAIQENAFHGLESLEHINLTSTNISHLSTATLAQLKQLKSINVSFANLDNINLSLEHFTKLQTFDISYNSLLCNGNYSKLFENEIFITNYNEDECEYVSENNDRQTKASKKPTHTSRKAPRKHETTAGGSSKVSQKTHTTEKPQTTTTKPVKLTPEQKLKKLITSLLDTNSGAVVIRSEKEKNGQSASKALLNHANLMTKLSRMEIELDGRNWTLADMCLKVKAPKFKGFIKNLIEPLLNKIIPCVIVTPLDCFWDGSKILGPHPPLVIPDGLDDFISGLPSGNLTWKNLNLDLILNSVQQLIGNLDIGGLKDALGTGYVTRQCLNPLETECPEISPNYYNECDAIEWLTENNYIIDDDPENQRVNSTDQNNVTEPEIKWIKEEALESCEECVDCGDTDYAGYEFDIFGGRKKRSTVHDLLDNYYQAMDKKDQCIESPKSQKCRTYSNSLLNHLKLGTLPNILPSNLLPRDAELTELETKGCPSIARKILLWKNEYLIDWTKNNTSPLETGKHMECIVKPETEGMYQSIVLFANSNDAIERIMKSTKKYKENRKKVNDILVALPSEWFKQAAKVIEAFKMESNIDACASDVSNKKSGEILKEMLVDQSFQDIV